MKKSYDIIGDIFCKINEYQMKLKTGYILGGYTTNPKDFANSIVLVFPSSRL